jgi:tRNA uridine 5-carbamoylmethylation protein Kti12
MKLTIIRGLPGSGKSTLALKMLADAQRNLDECVRLEADLFHTMPDGKYNYKPELQGYAHEFCRSTTAFYLNKGVDVIVANTFVDMEECLPYYKLAQLLGAEFNMIEATGNYKNVHGVPTEVIDTMKNKWEDFSLIDLECYYKEKLEKEKPQEDVPVGGRPMVPEGENFWSRFIGLWR